VRTELVELSPSPECERENHGRAEDDRRDRQAVYHAPMLALNVLARKFSKFSSPGVATAQHVGSRCRHDAELTDVI
jgi:hypothetical protein